MIQSFLTVRRRTSGILLDVPFAVLWRPSSHYLGGVLTLLDHHERSSSYTVAEQSGADGSRLFYCRKRGSNDCHCVRLSGLVASCDCRGFISCGYCRHSDAIGYLLSIGSLDVIGQVYRS